MKKPVAFVTVLIDRKGDVSISEDPVYGDALVKHDVRRGKQLFEPVGSRITENGTWVRVLREGKRR